MGQFLCQAAEDISTIHSLTHQDFLCGRIIDSANTIGNLFADLQSTGRMAAQGLQKQTHIVADRGHRLLPGSGLGNVKETLDIVVDTHAAILAPELFAGFQQHDAVLALLNEAARLLPGIKISQFCGFGHLTGDQQDVANRVAVEPGHNI